MSTLPKRIQDLLDFFDQHAEQWSSVATSIGLTAAQATAFHTLADTARESYKAQLSALQSAKDSTIIQRASTRAARQKAGELIAIIKAFAENSADPDKVYTAAQIPPPAAPGPVPPPGLPTDLRASLEPDGAVTLRWKCANPEGAGGTVYTVKRRIGTGSGTFTTVGLVGTRAFTDESLPASSAVQYTIQAQRGTSTGPACSPFTVQFGTGGGGAGVMITAQYSEEEGAGMGLKKAA